MPGSGVRFIRRAGRVIPIRAESGSLRSVASPARRAARASTLADATVGTGLAVGAAKVIKSQPQSSVHQGYRAASLGAAVVSGAVSALTTFHSSPRVSWAGQLASLGLDITSTALNAKSVLNSRGGVKNTAREKALAFARQEAINTLAGNAVFFGGVAANRSARRNAAALALRGYRKLKKVIG